MELPPLSALSKLLEEDRFPLPKESCLYRFLHRDKDTQNQINKNKEAIIAAALQTDEGRTALAQAMVEPIRRNLEYASIGRKLLMVDQLPVGALG